MIPELKDIFDDNTKRLPKFITLGDVLSDLINIAFYVAMLFAFTWLVWGAFDYIMAQGKKENLAKARAKITWAIIGLMVVFSAYFVAKFAGQIFPPTKGGLPF